MFEFRTPYEVFVLVAKLLLFDPVSLEVMDEVLVIVLDESPIDMNPYPASVNHMFSMKVYLKFVRNLQKTLSTVEIEDKRKFFEKDRNTTIAGPNDLEVNAEVTLVKVIDERVRRFVKTPKVSAFATCNVEIL